MRGHKNKSMQLLLLFSYLPQFAGQHCNYATLLAGRYGGPRIGDIMRIIIIIIIIK